MRKTSGFVKFERKIKDWSWYKNPATFKLFFHLVTYANFTPGIFEGVQIKRGQIAGSYSGLASETGLSIKQVRTAIKHLIQTQEVAQDKYSKFSVFTVLNYAKYQDKAQKTAGEGHSKGTAGAVEGQQYKNNKNKRNKEEGKEASHGPQIPEGFASREEYEAHIADLRR